MSSALNAVVYVLAISVGAFVGLYSHRPYAAGLTSAVLLALVLLPTAHRRVTSKALALFFAALLASCPAVSGRVPSAVLAMALEGRIPESPLAIEILSKVGEGNAVGPTLVVSVLWSLLLTSLFMLAYATFLVFKHLWVNVEKAPLPLMRTVGTVPGSLLARNVRVASTALFSALLTGLSSLALPQLLPAILALTSGLVSTVSFLFGSVVGVIASRVLGPSFSLGTQIGVAIYTVLALLVTRRRYWRYEVTLPAPTILTLLSMLFLAPFLFMMLSLSAAVYLVAYMAFSLLSFAVMLRVEGEFTLVLLAELLLLAGREAFALELQSLAASLMGFTGPFTALLVYPLMLPQVYLLFLLAALLIDDAREAKSFRGAAPLVLTFLACSAFSSYYSARWRPETARALEPLFSSVPSLANLDIVGLAAGVGAVLVATVVYLSGETRVPCSPLGVMFGSALVSLAGDTAFLLIPVFVLTAAVKLIFLKAMEVKAGALSQFSAALLWGSLLGLVTAELL